MVAVRDELYWVDSIKEDIIEGAPLSFEAIEKETFKDPTLSEVRQMILNEWPTSHSEHLTSYKVEQIIYENGRKPNSERIYHNLFTS